jgi:DNA-directed RNA polymerase II subunit RPB9
MATPQSTTASVDDNGQKKNLEQITFRFCSECSNMLYPKENEDTHKLQFTCRTCQYTEEATSTCVFRNILNNAAGETAGVTQDVGSDPTVSACASAAAAHHHHHHSLDPTTAQGHFLSSPLADQDQEQGSTTMVDGTNTDSPPGLSLASSPVMSTASTPASSPRIMVCLYCGNIIACVGCGSDLVAAVPNPTSPPTCPFETQDELMADVGAGHHSHGLAATSNRVVNMDQDLTLFASLYEDDVDAFLDETGEPMTLAEDDNKALHGLRQDFASGVVYPRVYAR